MKFLLFIPLLLCSCVTTTDLANLSTGIAAQIEQIDQAVQEAPLTPEEFEDLLEGAKENISDIVDSTIDDVADRTNAWADSLETLGLGSIPAALVYFLRESTRRRALETKVDKLA